MKEKRIMTGATTYVSYYHLDKMRRVADIVKLPVSRLIAIAVDNELERERPFVMDLDLPSDDYVEYAYADQAAKIITFMNQLRKGMGLDSLVIVRHDIGIPIKDEFLQAFRECLEKGMIEAFSPPRRLDGKSYKDDYMYYRVKDSSPEENKRTRKKATEFETYERLKKKFNKEK